jgi:uncharacterized protein
MPANLTPIYMDAEKRYKEAKTTEEKIAALEEMLAVIPKHKGTDKLQADLKKRLSKHKEESHKKKGAAVQKSVFSIDKEGAAQVMIVGPPNTGKSSLVAGLTNASPEIAPFPHTTHKPTPGMALFENIHFQLVDTPPITGEYIDPSLADLLRRADILAIVIDLTDDPLGQYEEAMTQLETFRIYPEGAVVPEGVRKPQFFKKMIVLANKMDTEKEREDFDTFLELTGTTIPAMGVSVSSGTGLQDFLGKVFELARVIRVFSKNPGKEPDLEEPFVLPQNSTLEELAVRIHKDVARKMKFARIWGTSVHDGQMVQRDYVLQDNDIVEIHI